MMPIQDYLHGLAETAATIVVALAVLRLTYRLVRYTHCRRAR